MGIGIGEEVNVALGLGAGVSVMVAVNVAVGLIVGLAVGVFVSVNTGTAVVGAGRLEGVEVGAGGGVKANLARITSRTMMTPIPIGIAYLRSVAGMVVKAVMGVTAGGSPVYPSAVKR